MGQFTITGEQAQELLEMLQANNDGEPVTLTKQGLDGALVVAFSMQTFEISTGGTVDEV